MKLTDQVMPSAEELVAPMIELNKIALGYTEKLVELNLALLRKQADVVLASWRDALAIKSVEQVQEYLTHQGQIARNVVEDYVAEAKAVTELNQTVANDMRKLVEENVAKTVKKAA